ncbi:MAG: hypothetical protein ACRDZU_09965 [Acidimicrobiales bacterium]
MDPPADEVAGSTDGARARRSRGIGLAVAAYSVLVAALLLASLEHTSSNRAAGADTRSCGAVLRPRNTWDDCIDARHRIELTTVVLGLLTMALGVAALRVLRARAGVGSAHVASRGRTQLGIGLVGVAAIATSISLAFVRMRAGGIECGTLQVPSGSLPQSSSGNIDQGCVDALQGRTAIVLTVGAVGLGLLVGSRLRSTARAAARSHFTAWSAVLAVSLGATLSAVAVLLDLFEFYSGAG